MRDQQINTFHAGMMNDLGATLPQEGSYTEGYNIRIVTSGPKEESGIVVSVDGTEKRVTLRRMGYVTTPADPIDPADPTATGPAEEGRRQENSVRFDPIIFGPDPGGSPPTDPGGFPGDTEDVLVSGVGHTSEGEDLTGYTFGSAGGLDLGGGISYPDFSLDDFVEEMHTIVEDIFENLDEQITLMNSSALVTPIGYTIIKKKLIVFGVSDCIPYEYLIGDSCLGRAAVSSASSSSCPCVGSIGSIHVIDLNVLIESTVPLSNEVIYPQSIIYQSSKLNFSTDNYIQAIGRYESEEIQRIYWTDNINPVRTLNIAQEGVANIPIEELGLGFSTSFSAPKITKVDFSGNLPAGSYQYAYRMKTTEGATSRFSSLSNITHVVAGSLYWNYQEDPEDDSEYSNTPPGESTNKAVHIIIPKIDENYDFVEIIAVYRKNKNAVDKVYIIEETTASDPVTVVHDSDDGEIIPLSAATEIVDNPTQVKTIASKDNRLFMAGLEYSPFNLQFNSRAYRYKRPDNIRYPRKSLAESSSSGQMTTYVDEDFNPIDSSGSSNYSIEENLDAINPFNTISKDELSDNQIYKFKKDGITLGGEGPFIEYEFTKSTLNGNIVANGNWDIPSGPPFVSSVFKSHEGDEVWVPGDYKSPENVAQITGYHRDEVYRFGIVLYDKQGNPGFVNWIGDIRFPSYEDYDHKATNGIYNYTLSQVFGVTGSGTNYFYEGTNSQTSPTEDAYELMHIGNAYEFALAAFGNGSKSMYNYNAEDYNQYAGGEMGALGIKFKVNLPDNIKDQISGYKIVRVERTQADKSILGTGMVNYIIDHIEQWTAYTDNPRVYKAFGSSTSGHNSSSTDRPLAYNSQDLTTGGDSIGQFKNRSITIDSPDFPFGEYPTSSSNFIQVIGAVTGRYNENFKNNSTKYQAGNYSAHTLAIDYENLHKTYSIKFATKLDRAGSTYIPGLEWQTDDHADDNNMGVLNFLTYNSGSSLVPDYTRGLGEETLFVHLTEEMDPYLWIKDNNTDFDTGRKNKAKLLASVRTDNVGQYGGNTDIIRKKNTYISAGPFISADEVPGGGVLQNDGAHEVWGGDTYVVVYDLEKIKAFGSNALGPGTNDPHAGFDPDNYGLHPDDDYFGKSNISISFAFPAESSFNTTLRGGWHYANKSDFERLGDTPLNQFILDSCYSPTNNTEVYIPEPINFKSTSVYDSRIIYSDAKINGESSDSWRKFKLENYRDVEGLYGGLNKLIVHDDILYYLQDIAFGKLSVSPVSTVIDESGSSIILGTGDVIQDFNYLSTSVGATNPFSVINSEKGIYWIDFNKKKAYAFRANGLNSISDVHGMKSFFNNNIIKDNIVLGYDYINSEVLFSMNSKDNTVVFNETLNKFTSIYSFSTPLFMSGINQLLSVGNNSNIFQHNMPETYNWHNNPHYTSEIEFIVNKNPLHSKIYDTLEWYLPDGALSRINFSNSYLNSDSDIHTEVVGEDAALNQNVYLREQMYRSAVPRDKASGRLRDTYLKIRMVFSNNTSGFKKVLLHYVKTLFRISRR